MLFQSTCPLRGTTQLRGAGDHIPPTISIHVPLAGHDEAGGKIPRQGHHFNPRAPCGARPGRASHSPLHRWNFNPRAPCGARPFLLHHNADGSAFQSTCPLRGTTYGQRCPYARMMISIHVPLAGHDKGTLNALKETIEFQSTCPLRGTTTSKSASSPPTQFQSTCPLRGTTKYGSAMT